MSAVIKVESLGKRYRIKEGPRYRALRDSIAKVFTAPGRFLKRHNSVVEAESTIWALRDLSFEVHEGEVVGLIGRNGAGKSTLLKVLSRVTKPTTGWAEVRGRMGSLLEVGTGFHPELTGRENVFLNGAILGMTKAEIRRKFDEIVTFAEIERFLDTPVKHYSSGMYVRLAFAVAAHLETEILFVDEVLAVGDSAFQKKCLGKMGDVSRQGRTIIFVSHNMAAVKTLCTRAILIQEGSVAADGPARSVIDEYLLGASAGVSAVEWLHSANAPGNENIRLRYVRVMPPENEATITIDSGATIEIEFENRLPNINLDCTVYVATSEGVVLFESGHLISSDEDSRRGVYEVTGTIPGHLLNAGRYSLQVVFGRDQRYVLFKIENAVSFDVENTTTGRGANMSVAPGFVRPLLSWRHSFEEKSALVKEF